MKVQKLNLEVTSTSKRNMTGMSGPEVLEAIKAHSINPAKKNWKIDNGKGQMVPWYSLKKAQFEGPKACYQVCEVSHAFGQP